MTSHDEQLARILNRASDRVGCMQDLIIAAAFIRSLPEDVSVRVSSEFTATVSEGSQAASIARVEEIAESLGVTAGWRNGHYSARRDFGGGVIYEVVYMPIAKGTGERET
jgi:hypothetical protein